MKLLTPAVIHNHDVTNGAAMHKMRLTFCTIDFGSTPFMLGKSIPELRFGDRRYKGVVPLRWNENQPTVAECAVQTTETV